MKLLVTGKGLLGKSLQRLSRNFDIQVLDTSVGDLRSRDDTHRVFEGISPDYVIHTASKVAGLGGHNNAHAKFLHDNLLINTNVVEACHRFGVKKAVFVSSVAAFPGNCSYLTEDNILEGRVHQSEYGYALSKRVMFEQIAIYRREYGSNFCCLLPVNIYGPEDQFNLTTAHCIASILHKFYLAARDKTAVEIWSDGLSIRQFIYVDDLSRVIFKLLNEPALPRQLIVANPEVFNIKDVVETVREITGFKGDVVFDKNKPSGLRSRECDVSRLKTMINDFQLTNLKDGLKITWDWLNENYDSARV